LCWQNSQFFWNAQSNKELFYLTSILKVVSEWFFFLLFWWFSGFLTYKWTINFCFLEAEPNINCTILKQANHFMSSPQFLWEYTNWIDIKASFFLVCRFMKLTYFFQFVLLYQLSLTFFASYFVKRCEIGDIITIPTN
jgi:hypothetical protein